MAEPLYYDLPTYQGRTFVYGKCLTSPYVENNLWFVFVPGNVTSLWFVDEKYATPAYFMDFGMGRERWEAVAHSYFLDPYNWNVKLEKSYYELPHYTFKLKNGEYIRYGLAKSEGKRLVWKKGGPIQEPNEELWYVILGVHPETEQDWGEEYYIVDKSCTTPAFLEAMGTDHGKWLDICWANGHGLEPWILAIENFNPDIYRYVKKKL